MQVMGHKDPKIFSKHYISKTTFADVQSLVQDEGQRTDLIKQIQRMSNLRDERAPKELPPEEKVKVEECSELKECKEAAAVSKSKITREYGSLREAPPAVRRDHAALKNKERDLSRKLEHQGLYALRREWFANMLTTPEGLQSEDMCSDLENFDEYIRVPEHEFSTERRRIATSFFGYPSEIDQPVVINDLVKLCSNRLQHGRRSTSCKTKTCHTKYFYPGEEPVGGECRFCGKDIDCIPPKAQAAHAHECAAYTLNSHIKKAHVRNLPQQCQWGACSTNFDLLHFKVSEITRHIQLHTARGFVCQWNWCGERFADRFGLRKHLKQVHRVSDKKKAFEATYCILCTEWFNCEFTWEDHCRTHIDALHSRGCSPAVMHPGRCLFCLGNTELPYSERFKSFEKPATLRYHTLKHLGEVASAREINCPHPVCADELMSLSYNSEEFKEHIKEIHGIDVNPISRKRKDSCQVLGPCKGSKHARIF